MESKTPRRRKSGGGVAARSPDHRGLGETRKYETRGDRTRTRDRAAVPRGHLRYGTRPLANTMALGGGPTGSIIRCSRPSGGDREHERTHSHADGHEDTRAETPPPWQVARESVRKYNRRDHQDDEERRHVSSSPTESPNLGKPALLIGSHDRPPPKSTSTHRKPPRPPVHHPSRFVDGTERARRTPRDYGSVSPGITERSTLADHAKAVIGHDRTNFSGCVA